MIDRAALVAIETDHRPVICTVCEALPAAQRKRLRDEVMTRDLERQNESPARAPGKTRAGPRD